MGKKYKKPPIVEALCEFQFISDQPLDLTLHGLIYEKVKDEFPDKQQQVGTGVQFRPTEKGIEHKVEPVLRTQFHKKDKTALIQVAHNLLAVNQLKPYPTWNKFKPMILKNFEIYKEIAHPKGFRSIKLGYINVIEFDKTPIKLKDYFQFYPFVPDALKDPYNSFSDSVEFQYGGGKERLILTLATVIPSKPDLFSILIRLEYVMAAPEYIPLSGVSEWLERAHNRIEDAFEASITDKAREIFMEDKS